MTTPARKGPADILTIGHSTRSIEDFMELLRDQAIQSIVDVRTVPKSRRNPQYNLDPLQSRLRASGVDYDHMPGLGGFRHPRRDSPNGGWRNEGFRGFADYMQTPEFEENVRRLIRKAREARVAIMCAEALPWRCHRSLIADALVVRGLRVEHIFSKGSTRPHELTSWARVDGTRLTYPAAEEKPGPFEER